MQGRELHAAPPEALYQIDEVRQRSPETIEPPDDKLIVGPHSIQETIECRAFDPRPRCVLFNNLITAGCDESINLKRQILGGGRYSRVAEFHSIILPQTIASFHLQLNQKVMFASGAEAKTTVIASRYEFAFRLVFPRLSIRTTLIDTSLRMKLTRSPLLKYQ